jgi:serralysin
MYFLDVGGYSTNTGSYSFSTRIDDVADDVNTTDSIIAGGVRSGTINSAADQDFFQIFLTAGQHYNFDVTGVGLSDPTLALRNSAGTQLAYDDDGGPGLNSHIGFTAGSSGTYYLDVGGYSTNTGSYNLSA